MPYRAMALVAASVLMMLSGSALAQKIDPTPDSKNLNSSRSNVDRMGGGGGGKGAAGFTGSPATGTISNLRMGGGGGGKGAAGVTTVKGSNSNSSDRMGAGGGGKGAVQLNPQPEPPGRTK
jgi:hypothetical protein